MNRRHRHSPKRRTPTRRWHIPPPLIHGAEILEGGGILQELPSRLGVTLWQGFRDVMLWTTSDPAMRGEIFVASSSRSRGSGVDAIVEAEGDSQLRSGLRVLEQLVASPATAREDVVGRACRQISDWAYEQGKLSTALAFAQNAALASRTSASAAFWVASVAFRLNDHARAEGWFRRAVGLARQSRDWRMYSRAFGGLGNLYIRRGNLPAARRLHTRALRGARRGGMRREQAAALHDLFVVSVETGNTVEAERLARQALEACGTRNRRLHVLAHDVAYFWMEQGHFPRALAVFQAVLPLVDPRRERLFVLADIVRAAGGIGDRQTADDAAASVIRLLADPDLDPGAGRALLEVARGYLSLGDNAKAEEAASAALASAIEHRENRVQFATEALLASVREKAAEVQAAEVPVSVQARASAADPQVGDKLAADFVRTLEVIAGTAP